VLVVDDDVLFRDLVAKTLTRWGYRVVAEAGSVTEALALAHEFRPDAALVDIGLPDGDGFSLTEALRCLPWPLEVVLISSDPDPANGPAAERAGAEGFIPKDRLSSDAVHALLGEPGPAS
jgi:DNA-binding NarL/FixJ family response regulator